MGTRAGMGSLLNKESLLITAMVLVGRSAEILLWREGKAGGTGVQGRLRKYCGRAVPVAIQIWRIRCPGFINFRPYCGIGRLRWWRGGSSVRGWRPVGTCPAAG